MNQPQTQTRKYWAQDFAVNDADIEQIYNHLLEAERPQTLPQLTRVIITYRVTEEQNRLQKLMAGRSVYQPKESYEIGDELVFPALRFALGTVAGIRDGYDPQHGQFKVLAVELNGKKREFAAELPGEHDLNQENGASPEVIGAVDVDEVYESVGEIVSQKIGKALETRDEFVRLADLWFVKGLMAEVNVGHLHLAEAVLEVNEGGPLETMDIMVHLDMDEGLDPEVRRFSLDHALLNDERFDEVGPPGEVAWFLRRLEPEPVQSAPERLAYEPVAHDQDVLTPQLLLLERELDDEWSDIEPAASAQPTILSLTYPHRWAGTLPLSSRTSPLFPTGISQRQRVTLVDENSSKEIRAWVVREGRYIYGLGEWYEEHGIPIGGFITLKPGPKPGVVLLDYDRRRPQREYVRLASVVDGRVKFELEKRSVGCGYDDLLIVGTDYVSALDAIARRGDSAGRSLVSWMMELFPELANLTPQKTVHAKTLYSAVNMVLRMPPGPLFAELVQNAAFQPVGDHYWQLNR